MIAIRHFFKLQKQSFVCKFSSGYTHTHIFEMKTVSHKKKLPIYRKGMHKIGHLNFSKSTNRIN